MYDQHQKNGENQAQEPGWVGRKKLFLETKALKTNCPHTDISNPKT